MYRIILSALLALSIFISFANANEEEFNLQTPTLDDFESAENVGKWTLKASDNKIEANCKIKSSEGAPEALVDYYNQGKKYCMGIKGQFKSKGFNWISVIPPEPIKIPGKVSKIKLWVAGMNYDWTAEVWVKDYDGYEHKLPFGSINFRGWRCLTAYIENYIPQDSGGLPKNDELKIVRIVFRANPDARPDRFYVYIDQLKVITDVYVKRYDGVEFLNQQW